MAIHPSTKEIIILAKSFATKGGPSRKLERKSFLVLENGLAVSEDQASIESYDVLRFTAPYSRSFREGLYEFILELDVPLYEAVGAINNFFAGNKGPKLKELRGAFAELALLLDDKSLRTKYAASTFDFEKNGIDIEVKSIALDSRSVWFSNSQLFDNPEAMVYLVEVAESSAGKTARELLEKAKVSGIEGLDRYAFLDMESEIGKTKFITKKYGSFSIKSFSLTLTNDTSNINPSFEYVSAKVQYKILPSALRLDGLKLTQINTFNRKMAPKRHLLSYGG